MDREVTAAPPAFGELRRLGWRRLFGYLRPYHWQMAAAIVGLLVASAIGLAFRRRRRGVGPAARAPEHAGAGRPGPVHRGRGGGAVGHQGSAELRPRGLRGRALHRFGIGQLASLYGEARQALGAVRRVFELLDAQSTVRDQPGAPALPRVTGEIHFDHVSFGYGPGATVLRDIDLTVAPGEIVALVGPSGAGKSTLFNLIPRFYDPTAGAVRIDGRDLRAVTAASVREQVGLVPQETLLFGGTVRENIRYGRLAASDAEIEAAARAANAHEFIAALPQGYDTVVGERGTRLSGGQRQRIAIARAILKDPRILLLDEATSALDTESERLVQAALHRLMQGRTTVVIAHRLSTVVAAHRIVVLDGGRIVEQGSHEALLAQRGLYARLYALQFEEGPSTFVAAA